MSSSGTWGTVLVASVGGSARHAAVIDFTLRPTLLSLGCEVVPVSLYATAAEVARRDASLSDRVGRAASQLVLRATSTPDVARLARGGVRAV